MAVVLGPWDRYEPRPPEHEIDADLFAFCDWLARVGGLNSADIAKVAQFAGIKQGWPEGSVVRRHDERLADLTNFPYEPHYVEIEGLRMAYVEAGEGDPILLLHGEPTWGYLYRHMIPTLAKLGRVIVPDLIGFGRSDKPVAANSYSYKSHVRWLRGFMAALDLQRITMVCQDWGGVLGLRILVQIPVRLHRSGRDEHGNQRRSRARRCVSQVAAFFAARRVPGHTHADAKHPQDSQADGRGGGSVPGAVSVQGVSDRRAGISAPGADPAGLSGRVRKQTGHRKACYARFAGVFAVGRRRCDHCAGGAISTEAVQERCAAAFDRGRGTFHTRGRGRRGR